MKYKDCIDHDLHCVKNWVIFLIEGIDTSMFKGIKDKEVGVGGGVKSGTYEAPIHINTQVDSYVLLEDS